jgi:hypothetical protein
MESLWELMETYNQATARSTTHGADPESRSGRARLTFLNQMRASLFDEWIAKGFDGGAVARAANRMGSEIPWKARSTHTYLSFALTDQLDVEINEDARLSIFSIIKGFYDGAKESIKEVKIIK